MRAREWVVGVALLAVVAAGCTGVDEVSVDAPEPDAVVKAADEQPVDVLSSRPEHLAWASVSEPAAAPEPGPEPAPEPEPEPEPELVAGPPIWGVGSQGDDVRELQARLRQIWWFNADPTGYYGEVTAMAVRGFQNKRGFPVVGYIDQRTWDRIVSMTHEPSQDELYPPPPEPDPAPEPVQASLPAGIDSRCTTGRVICVDKTQRVLRWMVDGQVRLTMDARFGSPDYPTEEGAFRVYKKVYDDWSIQFDAPMQMSLYYYGGEAVHYSETFARDGYAGASHGCVNTRSWGGQTQLFNEAQIGDRVIIYWS